MRRLRGRTKDGGAAGVSLELGRGGPHGPAGEWRSTGLEAGAGVCRGDLQEDVVVEEYGILRMRKSAQLGRTCFAGWGEA